MTAKLYLIQNKQNAAFKMNKDVYRLTFWWNNLENIFYSKIFETEMYFTEDVYMTYKPNLKLSNALLFVYQEYLIAQIIMMPSLKKKKKIINVLSYSF